MPSNVPAVPRYSWFGHLRRQGHAEGGWQSPIRGSGHPARLRSRWLAGPLDGALRAQPNEPRPLARLERRSVQDTRASTHRRRLGQRTSSPHRSRESAELFRLLGRGGMERRAIGLRRKQETEEGPHSRYAAAVVGSGAQLRMRHGRLSSSGVVADLALTTRSNTGSRQASMGLAEANLW